MLLKLFLVKNMNVAIIDLGTNSFHLIIAKIFKNEYQIVHREREVVHLRKNSDTIDYFIENDRINLALNILDKFYKIIKSYDAEVYAFGTSALRDARNKGDFISKVRENYNFEIEILSGEEEAELISFGINYHYDVKDKSILIFDLGGGSTEFVFQKCGKIKLKKSLNLGAVRQTQKWFPDYTFSTENINHCKDEISKQLNLIENITDIDQIFGIGGTITAITWLIEKNIYKREHHFKLKPNYVITKNDFILVKDMIINHALKNELDRIIGIDDQRLKIIVAGILIVEKIFDKFLCESILATGISIRESYLIKNFLQNK